MKKTLIYFSLITLIFFCSTGCKKDYPTDIPKWVKTAIKEFKRSGKSHGLPACVDCAVSISEYHEVNTNARVYFFDICGDAQIFDESGHLLCDVYMWVCGNQGCNCGIYSTKNFVFSRKIWHADC